MITNVDLENLHNAALLYNELRGRDYLIGYGTNSRKEIKLTEIRINPQNFWHLLGYRIKDNIPADTRTMLYTMVLINSPSDIETLKNSLDCLHGKQIRDEKYNVFMKEFNFIYNAKINDLANTQNTPDVANFDFAMGNDAGIIGYKLSKRPRDEHKHMPASVQTKSIDKLNKPVNDIFLIFSKNIVSDEYDNIDYSISKNMEFIKQAIHNIPKCFNIKITMDNIQVTNSKINKPKEIERE